MVQPVDVGTPVEDRVATVRPDQSLAERSRRDPVGLVVIASSAGGVAALPHVLRPLPPDFRVPILVLQHLAPHIPSALVAILARATPLTVRSACDGAILAAGVIDVAPPDHHVVIRPDGLISLSQTEQVHHVRPSADVLFGSAAAAYGARTLAVVLTGTGSDAAAGVHAIHAVGGIVVVQDRASSDFTGMPDAALATGVADHVLPLDEIAPMLIALVADRHR